MINMGLKTLRQIFKACAEDTRLRILSILQGRELAVKEICSVLKANQPAISKHLATLRLMGIVVDKRRRNQVYYSLNQDQDSAQSRVLGFIFSHFHDIEAFKSDKELMKHIKGEL